MFPPIVIINLSLCLMQQYELMLKTNPGFLIVHVY